MAEVRPKFFFLQTSKASWFVETIPKFNNLKIKNSFQFACVFADFIL